MGYNLLSRSGPRTPVQVVPDSCHNEASPFGSKWHRLATKGQLNSGAFRWPGLPRSVRDVEPGRPPASSRRTASAAATRLPPPLGAAAPAGGCSKWVERPVSGEHRGSTAEVSVATGICDTQWRPEGPSAKRPHSVVASLTSPESVTVPFRAWARALSPVIATAPY